MNNLTVFSYETQEVRTLIIDNKPWFVAKDVLLAMQSTTTVTAVEAMVVDGLGEEFVSNQPLQTKGGTQNLLCLSEAALTFFISRSRTEAGKQINRWIHTEVLPSIRKTGSYSLKPEPIALPQRDTIDYVNAAKDLASLPANTLTMLLKDCLIDELELKRNIKALPDGNQKKEYTIVKVRARELGYTEKEVGNGSSLGKFIRARVECACQERIGIYNVFHYEITPELDEAIHAFFDSH
jgi:prophage antirepressor-like protein